MKNLIISALALLVLTTSAFSESNLKVSCRNNSGLPSGLSLTISSQEDLGGLVAEITNRDNIGPFVNLGQIPVVREEYPDEVMGAPITYIGSDFILDIIWDGGRVNGAFPSHIKATIQGRTFDEPMTCQMFK
jgi:hypothetical protein